MPRANGPYVDQTNIREDFEEGKQNKIEMKLRRQPESIGPNNNIEQTKIPQGPQNIQIRK